MSFSIAQKALQTSSRVKIGLLRCNKHVAALVPYKKLRFFILLRGQARLKLPQINKLICKKRSKRDKNGTALFKSVIKRDKNGTALFKSVIKRDKNGTALHTPLNWRVKSVSNAID
jgi:hypothetical protein